jgi:hypothetical protein
MAITSLSDGALVLFVTQDELEQLAQQVPACLLMRGRKAFPKAGWLVALAVVLLGREVCGLAGLLHDGLLLGWRHQQ